MPTNVSFSFRKFRSRWTVVTVECSPASTQITLPKTGQSHSHRYTEGCANTRSAKSSPQWTKKVSPDLSFHFQKHMPYFRRRMVWEIVNRKLLWYETWTHFWCLEEKEEKKELSKNLYKDNGATFNRTDLLTSWQDQESLPLPLVVADLKTILDGNVQFDTEVQFTWFLSYRELSTCCCKVTMTAQ